VPVVYSGSPAMAIAVPRGSGSAASAQSDAAALTTELQSLGCEVLRVDASTCAELHAPGLMDRLTHVIYNKSYDAAELVQALGSEARGFQAGFDLQALLQLGPRIWARCDHVACLGLAGADPEAPTLRLFVDMAQLSEDTFKAYEQFALAQKQQGAAAHAAAPVTSGKPAPASAASWACAGCTFLNSAQASQCDMCAAKRPAAANEAVGLSLPPPPPAPPAIPAPPLTEDSSAPTTATFSVTSWNTLSADYAAPATFSYCDRSDLAFPARKQRILDHLASAAARTRDGVPTGSDIDCLQEVDFDAVADGVFDTPEHGSVFVRRPHHKRDGCLIRWKEASFELMPLPELVCWAPKTGASTAPSKRDPTLARVRCASHPEANLDQLGQRTKRGDKGSAHTQALAASVASLAPVLSAEQQDLAKRQERLLDTVDALTQRMRTLKARVYALTKGARASAVYTSAPASAAAMTRWFHPVHLNDLSFLTRSKRNCHSSLFARYKRENVGVIVLLRHRASGRLVLVLCAHAFWNEEFADVKLHQAMYLMQQLEEMRRAVAELYDVGEEEQQRIAVVCGGDFNATPSSAVYELLTRGSVPLVSPPLLGTGAAAPPVVSSSSPVPIVSSPFHSIEFAHESVPLAEEQQAAAAHKQHQHVNLPEMHATVAASMDDSAASSLSTSPNTRVKLLLDGTLLRVTKWLRAIGVDTVCQSSTTVPAPIPGHVAATSTESAVDAFFTLARKEGRIVVTQNKALLRRRGAPVSSYAVETAGAPVGVNGKDSGGWIPLTQFEDICQHFGFQWDEALFYTRCTTCNAVVERLPREVYDQLPFLPAEYKLGVDDEGDALVLTRCTASDTCGRVRWWSSQKQLRVRQKLFRARLGIDDISDLDEEQWDALGAPLAETMPAASASSAAAAASSNSNGSTVAASASRGAVSSNGGGSPIDQDLEMALALSLELDAASGKKARRAAKLGFSSHEVEDVAAARAARKANKAEMKQRQAAAAALRKQANQNSVANAMAADLIPSRAHEGISPVRGIRPPANPSAAAAASVPRELHSQQKAMSLAAAGTDVQSLWWTGEKKAHTIQVERRIAAETRRLMRARRAQKERAAAMDLEESEKAQEAAAIAASLADLDIAASCAAEAEAATASTFAARVHAYWQFVADRYAPGGPRNASSGAPFPPPEAHAHSLDLASAYAAASSCDSEPAFTNCTDRFKATIDYLLFSRSALCVRDVRSLVGHEDLQRLKLIGFPSAEWPSDHLMLRATYEIC